MRPALAEAESARLMAFLTDLAPGMGEAARILSRSWALKAGLDSMLSDFPEQQYKQPANMNNIIMRIIIKHLC